MSRRRVANIIKELDALFSDTSVPKEKTRRQLEELKEHIESLLETL